MGSRQYDSLRSFPVEKVPDSHSVQKVQFLMAPAYEIREPSLFQILPDSGTDQSAMSGNVYSRVPVQHVIGYLTLHS